MQIPQNVEIALTTKKNTKNDDEYWWWVVYGKICQRTTTIEENKAE